MGVKGFFFSRLGIMRLRSIESKFYGSKIFIACLPKTGSTFIVKTISKLIGWPYQQYMIGKGRNEQDLFEPLLRKGRFKRSCTHQHVRATEYNIQLLNKYHIKPIVLVRNIFDSIISLRDHIETENHLWPMVYINDSYYKLSPAKRLDFLIDMVVPWYLQFYVSWKDYSFEKKIHWINYSDLARSSEIVISDILNHMQIDFSQRELTHLIRKEKFSHRFNKGVEGRGKIEMTHKQRMRILEQTQYYDCNFNELGLFGLDDLKIETRN